VTDDAPWVVIGIILDSPASGGAIVGIEYTAPGGRTGKWQGGGNSASAVACWQKAKVGEPLPECAKVGILK
jgi:hypothetical protein